MRIVLVACYAGIGMLVGAWASWLAFRLAVPPGAAPVSRCPHCRVPQPAGWRGWLRLRGHCPACCRPTVRSWPYLAAATAGFAALAWRLPAERPADVMLLVAWLLMAGAGMVLAGIDVAVHRLPRPILAGTAAAIGPLVAAAAVCAHDPGLLLRAGLTATAFGAVYLILAAAGPGLVGIGDVYLVALLGLLLGTGPLPAVVVGAVAPYLLGAPVTAIRLALGRVDRRSQVAWGPYLIAGAVLAKVLVPV